MAANSYEKYIWAEVVVPDRKGKKLIGKIRKYIKYDDIITGEGHYIVMHEKYVYEVDYTDLTVEQQKDNITTENMRSKVDSEAHQYQVLTEVNDHKRDDSDITNMYGLIKSSNGNLH